MLLAASRRRRNEATPTRSATCAIQRAASGKISCAERFQPHRTPYFFFKADDPLDCVQTPSFTSCMPPFTLKCPSCRWAVCHAGEVHTLVGCCTQE